MKDNLTLQQGLYKFQEENGKYFSDNVMSKEAKRFLQSHDIAHVVFGCNTSIYGEGIVKIWTTFGTDLGFWKVTKGYKAVKAFNLARKYSLPHVVKNLGRLLWKIPLTIRRSKQMNKPWTWSEYQPYLDLPISEIRKEFNIQVID